ncbi:MAG: 1-acyl-sn-glycerol-3-phosphate acyltransferase [Bauldia sp.]|nr:1-acyl-sn-glycerol-3-phosphate acyltransferase [Bauldia sp.]
MTLRRIAAIAFFAVVVRPALLVVTGLRAEGRGHLPDHGPAVIAANHNSHLDVVALMSLFPLARLHEVRPVAAADHFLRPGMIGWLARNLLGIIPIERSGKGAMTALEPVRAALRNGETVIIFPEGTRGAPEVMQAFRRGVTVLAEEFPEAPFVPVHLAGLGKTLPRGAWWPVPFSAEARIGPPRRAADAPTTPMAARLEADIAGLARGSASAGFAVE